MITISSYQHQSLQRPVQVGRIGSGLAEPIGVTAPLALAAAMVGGVHAGAGSTAVTSDALILLRRLDVGAFSDRFAGQLGLHRRGCPSRSDSFALPCSSREWHQAGCERGVLTLLRSPR